MKKVILLLVLFAFIGSGSSSLAVPANITSGIYLIKYGDKHKCNEKCEKDCKEAAKCSKKKKRKCSKSADKKGCCKKAGQVKKACCAKKSSTAKTSCGSKSAKSANTTQEQ